MVKVETDPTADGKSIVYQSRQGRTWEGRGRDEEDRCSDRVFQAYLSDSLLRFIFLSPDLYCFTKTAAWRPVHLSELSEIKQTQRNGKSVKLGMFFIKEVLVVASQPWMMQWMKLYWRYLLKKLNCVWFSGPDYNSWSSNQPVASCINSLDQF